jgi:hypothetical protein
MSLRAPAPTAIATPRWSVPFDPEVYDRARLLTTTERTALAELRGSNTRWPKDLSAAVARLTDPIDDVLGVVMPQTRWWGRYPARRALVVGLADRVDSFWAWDRERWVSVLRQSDPQIRQIVMAVGYLACGQRDLHLEFRGFKARKFASRVLGTEAVDATIASVQGHLDCLGYSATLGRPHLEHALMEVLLLSGSPLLEDLALRADLLAWLRGRERHNGRRHGVEQLARTLVKMGVLKQMPFATQPSREEWLARSQAGETEVPAEWLGWTRRWFETSTLARTTRVHVYYGLIKAGRWLHREHSELAEPRSWTREHCAEWVAAVDELLVGELSQSQNVNYMRGRYGGPLTTLESAADLGAADILLRPAGVGVDRAAVRHQTRVPASPLDQGAYRP